MVATTGTNHRVDYGGNDWYKGLEAQYCVLCSWDIAVKPYVVLLYK